LGSSLPKIGEQKLIRLFGFSTTSRLNGEYLLSEIQCNHEVEYNARK